MSPESVPCPACSAPIGVECRRPNKRRAKVPHLERRQLAGCAIPTTGSPPTLIAVPCSLCGAPIGVRCLTSEGREHRSGHEVRRATAGLTPRSALKIAAEEVELWVIEAISQNLINGSIDQLNSTVTIT